MSKAIFQLNADKYDDWEVVKRFTRHICEHLANTDEENVTKFDLEGESLEDLLNNDRFDTTNCFFKVFI